MTKEDIVLRKRITSILRHGKKVVNSKGWIGIYRLSQILGVSIKKAKFLVKTDPERYEYSCKSNMVRAKRGHTNGVKIEGSVRKPPEVLYYGVKLSELGSTMTSGSSRRVHLVDTRKFARNGLDRNASVVLTVMSGEMYREGYKFSKSIYDEWYVDNLPSKYIRLIA